MSFPGPGATRVPASSRSVRFPIALLALVLALDAVPALGIGGLSRASAKTALSCESLVPPGSAPALRSKARPTG